MTEKCPSGNLELSAFVDIGEDDFHLIADLDTFFPRILSKVFNAMDVDLRDMAEPFLAGEQLDKDEALIPGVTGEVGKITPPPLIPSLAAAQVEAPLFLVDRQFKCQHCHATTLFDPAGSVNLWFGGGWCAA